MCSLSDKASFQDRGTRQKIDEPPGGIKGRIRRPGGHGGELKKPDDHLEPELHWLMSPKDHLFILIYSYTGIYATSNF